MHPALTLAVYTLAVARVTRLLTSDRVLDAPRRWLVIRLWAPRIPDEAARHWRGIYEKHGKRAAQTVVAGDRFDAGGEKPLGAYLVTCPWCVSVYVGGVAAPLWYWLSSSPWLLVPAIALAFSYVTGFLASKEA